MWGRLIAIGVPLMTFIGCGQVSVPETENVQAREDSWSLYRRSVIDNEARVYLGTFDSLEKAYDKSGPGYNQTNCEIAEDLFENQPSVIVDHWCEPTTDRKSSYAD